ncbi:MULTISPECIES: Ger(x)C family spore germination protein [Paenibacillus]|uniref:Ger(X)C family spore germination protein n=1 Tax=Paenibacillus albilobatus TaxID=2716884 RepID=A0A919XIE7_9BACL|nr:MULTISPECIES: Ger(x)C family spore germination protein [Paenibacillus]GIO31312.1 hypothetical protein J2TS6_24530 [Paenibacillus albilobatus]
MRRFFRSQWLGKLVLALTIMSSISGCWSSYEINNLAIVTLLGIDLDENGQFKMSALIVDPTMMNSGGQGGGKMESPFLIASATGTNLFDSIRKISSTIPKKVYWAHLQAIIFGSEAAKDKMIPALDILARQHEFRKNIDVLVSKGKASDIIGMRPNLKSDMGAEIRGIIRLSPKTSLTMVSDISRLTQDISSDRTDHITGEISPSMEKGVEIIKSNKTTSAVSIRGTAVFKQDHFAGWMDQKETRGVLFLRDKVKGGIAKVPCRRDPSGMVSLQFSNVTTQKTPMIVNGQPEMKVSIDVKADIDEITCPDFHLNTQEVQYLNLKLKEQVIEYVEKALQKGQRQWGTDIFEFGDVIYKRFPKEWAKLKSSWRIDGLKKMKVRLDVSAHVTRSGLISDPLQAEESR